MFAIQYKREFESYTNQLLSINYLWNKNVFRIYSYLNYKNVAWASTNKSSLISLFHHQEDAMKVIHGQDCFPHRKPLFKYAKVY